VNGIREARSYPAVADALAEVRRFLRERAAEAGLSSAMTEDLILAASEASANAVLHSGSSDFQVEWIASDDAVEIVVRDGGSFKRRVRLASVDGPGGFGIPLMTALADQIQITEGSPRRPGTLIRLVKRRA
jgi:anti-sigma regulatory factor (Ser/Thr protein kinase)